MLIACLTAAYLLFFRYSLKVSQFAVMSIARPFFPPLGCYLRGRRSSRRRILVR
jgi:hypothetical protein